MSRKVKMNIFNLILTCVYESWTHTKRMENSAEIKYLRLECDRKEKPNKNSYVRKVRSVKVKPIIKMVKKEQPRLRQ